MKINLKVASLLIFIHEVFNTEHNLYTFWRAFSRWKYLKSREKSKQTLYNHQHIITWVPQRTSRWFCNHEKNDRFCYSNHPGPPNLMCFATGFISSIFQSGTQISTGKCLILTSQTPCCHAYISNYYGAFTYIHLMFMANVCKCDDNVMQVYIPYMDPTVDGRYPKQPPGMYKTL